MRIVFLGSNPSNASPMDEAFTHCKSRKTLDKWIEKLGLRVYDVDFMNVSNTKTPNNRMLFSNEIEREVDRLVDETYNKVTICLGTVAKKAMALVNKKADRKYITLPHPSGRNPQANDSEWLDGILLEAKKALAELI